jgi:hypothetical protein
MHLQFFSIFNRNYILLIAVDILNLRYPQECNAKNAQFRNNHLLRKPSIISINFFHKNKNKTMLSLNFSINIKSEYQ